MKMLTRMTLLTCLAFSFNALAEDPPAPAPTPAPPANTRMTNPSALVVEILGRGLVYTVGFDRVLTEDISVGVGFSSAATEINGVDTNHRATIIPTWVNFYFNRTAGSIFITGGADVIANSGKVRNDEASTSGVDFPKDALMPTFGAGWEYRGDSGFLFRITGYGIAGDKITPWAGFTFGYGF